VRSKLEKPTSAAGHSPPKFTFSVFRCSVYVEGVFSLFFSSAWWKYFARISTSYRTRPRDDALEANLTPLR